MRSNARGLSMMARGSGSINRPDTEAQDQPSPDHHFRLATRGRSIQKGQKRHEQTRQIEALFDHLAGAGKKCRRHSTGSLDIVKVSAHRQCPARRRQASRTPATTQPMSVGQSLRTPRRNYPSQLYTHAEPELRVPVVRQVLIAWPTWAVCTAYAVV